MQLAEITTVIVNYKTYDLTRRCLESWLSAYPQVRVLLVDNGSADESTTYIRHMSQASVQVDCLLNRNNRHHGPALHQAIRALRTPFIFTLDSDCQVVKPGFLEIMIARLADPTTYAVGELQFTDWLGFETKPQEQGSTGYIHPAAMLIRREIYRQLPRFQRHGAPCLRNMRAAVRRGYELLDFPVADYIQHDGQGTCSRYGYQLGLGFKLQYFIHQSLAPYQSGFQS